uniref:DUF1619 domain-containing protein n=1 Tax=Trichuris muris TaxID=70415 RepID=A0A5S6QL49_TRIMR
MALPLCRSSQQCQFSIFIIVFALLILRGNGKGNGINGHWKKPFQSDTFQGCCLPFVPYAIGKRSLQSRRISHLFDVVIDNSHQHESLEANGVGDTAREKELLHVRRKRFTRDHLGNEEIPNAYAFGTTLLAVTEDDMLFKFFFPRPLLSKYCNYNGHARFMLNEQHVCLQSVAKLSELCEKNKALSASFFFKNYRLLKSPSLLNGSELSGQLYADFGNPFSPSTTNESIAVQLVTHKGDQNGKAKRSDIPAVGEPIWDASSSVCRNVALKADFVIRVDRGDFPRHFSIRYDAVANGTSVGYKLTSPITVFSSGVNSNENSTKGEEPLAVPKPMPDGDCDRSNQHVVRFGYNTFGSCFIRLPTLLNLTVCQRIQQFINEIIYASSEVLQLSHYLQATRNDKNSWMPVLMKEKPSLDEVTFEDGRCRLVMDARMEIIYIRDYDHLNDTYRLIEASISFGKPERLPSLVDSAGFGTGQSSHRYIVQMAVVFSDRTQPEERSTNIALPVIFNELYSLFFDVFE